MTAHDALKALLERYTNLINSGDAGHWDPEREQVVIDARAALAAGDRGQVDYQIKVLTNEHPQGIPFEQWRKASYPSLLDHYAGLAMQALLSQMLSRDGMKVLDDTARQTGRTIDRHIAILAFNHAAAMLQEKEARA